MKGRVEAINAADGSRCTEQGVRVNERARNHIRRGQRFGSYRSNMTSANTNAQEDAAAVSFNVRLNLRMSYQRLKDADFLVGESSEDLEDARAIVVITPLKTA